ncbi:hypothetical protein KR52_12410 [Synechococcus sp. KORDI-52]|nr:hypothetical protein KR52_12410 [Synechococcus sp. KORDI-52]
MPTDTRFALFLLVELATALRANDPDAFRCWLSGGVKDLGEPLVEKLLLDWFNLLLTVDEQEKLKVCRLGVSIQSFRGRAMHKYQPI